MALQRAAWNSNEICWKCLENSEPCSPRRAQSIIGLAASLCSLAASLSTHKSLLPRPCSTPPSPQPAPSPRSAFDSSPHPKDCTSFLHPLPPLLPRVLLPPPYLSPPLPSSGCLLSPPFMPLCPLSSVSSTGLHGSSYCLSPLCCSPRLNICPPPLILFSSHLSSATPLLSTHMIQYSFCPASLLHPPLLCSLPPISLIAPSVFCQLSSVLFP